MAINRSSAFAGACQDAMTAVLEAIASEGDERRGRLAEAKLAVDRASQDAHSGEEWYFAEHLRRGIKEVEACSLDAA